MSTTTHIVPARNIFGLAAEPGEYDWRGIQFALENAGEEFEKGVCELIAAGTAYGILREPTYQALLDSAKLARELARQLAAKSYVHAEGQAAARAS